MQGSLDNPPIVIRSSRWKAAVFLLISAGFVASGIWMLTDPKTSPWIAWLVIVFFGLGIPVFAARLVRPDVLTLAPDGITWRSTFRTPRWTWDQVHSFRPYLPNAKTVVKHVGFDFTDSYRGKDARLRGAAKTLTGVEGSLGGDWELSTAELCDLLNRAQARWAARPR